MTSPETERTRVADHLRAQLLADGGDPVDVPTTPAGDGPTQRPRVVVQVATVANANGACPTRSMTFDVWVTTPKVEPGPADVEVDDTLGRVLDALDTLPRSTWTTAERGVWQETYPGYRVETETRT